ncbi:MAG: R3H domain-containing nucleic acid-binding protein [Coriobacteriia bacterium]|nr:R3H domain-containing nucleic acid-binding protein [Coriobacteriia bacterium]
MLDQNELNTSESEDIQAEPNSDLELKEDYSDSINPELTRKLKAGEELSDKDIDFIADISVNVIRDILSFFDAEDSPIDEYEGDEGELIFDVINSELAVLIGKHGKTLDAIQLLATSIIYNKINYRFPIVIDIESYKNRRKQKLIELAINSAHKAINQNRSVRLYPMNAYERRIVHVALRDNVNVKTYSEGEDPQRRIVIQPAD